MPPSSSPSTISTLHHHGSQQQQQTIQTSTIPYPHSPERALHISLTTLATSYLIFLTSTSSSTSSFTPVAPTTSNLSADPDLDVNSTPRSLSPLGSFVYGLPNRFSPVEPLTTPLVSVPDTVELATRICRILVIRLAKLAGPRAVYVGCSITVDGLADGVREGLDVVGGVVEEIGRLVEVQQQQRKE